MTNLDNIKKIKELDKKNVLGSIELLAKQIEQGFAESKKIQFPDSYKKIKNIIVAGMGGSGLGPHIIKNLYAEELNVSFEVRNNYTLPNYLDDDSLCILSSYSGNTEEVLAAAEDAVLKQLLITGITTGGKLATFLKDHNFPAYIFKPKFNPSGQPRLAAGYSIAGQLGMLTSAGFLNIKDAETKEIVKFVQKLQNKYGVEIPEKDNLAKQFAKKLKQKIIILAGSEFLIGNLHTMANQINETAKQFSSYFEIPELNHHLMEGLKYPESNKQDIRFLFIKSNLYHPRIQARYAVTEKIIKQNNIEYLEFIPEGKNKSLQVFELLAWGSYVSFYLAMLNDIDPAQVPFVDFFKEELNKI